MLHNNSIQQIPVSDASDLLQQVRAFARERYKTAAAQKTAKPQPVGGGVVGAGAGLGLAALLNTLAPRQQTARQPVAK